MNPTDGLLAALDSALAWLDAHQLVAWLAGSAAANVLADVLGQGNTRLAAVCRALGVDLRRILARSPAAAVLVPQAPAEAAEDVPPTDRSPTAPDAPHAPVQAVDAPPPAPGPVKRAVARVAKAAKAAKTAKRRRG